VGGHKRRGRVSVLCGSNRWTVLAGGLAFKVPNPSSWRSLLYGLLNNMNERWAASVAEGDAHCPVRLYIPGGFLNIMPRCQPLNDSDWQDFSTHATAFAGALEVEQKPDSFGILDGRIVAVDYGIPRERW
jgi:hypothetical protein